jgi:hypothetical protein
MSRIFEEAVPLLARAARRLWTPEAPDSEAGCAIFSHFPKCVGSIRVLDGRGLFRRKALFAKKYSCACWKVLCAVAPNGICLWFAHLAPGGRHDKRILDESDPPAWFRCIALDGGQYLWKRHVILADRGFQGPVRFWVDALVKPMGKASGDIEAEYFGPHDNNRVIVEQLNGRIKEVFLILSDQGYRGRLTFWMTW